MLGEIFPWRRERGFPGVGREIFPRGMWVSGDVGENPGFTIVNFTGVEFPRGGVVNSRRYHVSQKIFHLFRQMSGYLSRYRTPGTSLMLEKNPQGGVVDFR